MMKDNAFLMKEKRPFEDRYINIIAKDLDWNDF